MSAPAATSLDRGYNPIPNTFNQVIDAFTAPVKELSITERVKRYAQPELLENIESFSLGKYQTEFMQTINDLCFEVGTQYENDPEGLKQKWHFTCDIVDAGTSGNEDRHNIYSYMIRIAQICKNHRILNPDLYK